MKKIFLLAAVFFVLQSFAQQKHPSFMQQGNIYEVNIRQYTPEGTFNAFAKHIPRFKKMGVQTLWLMPIQLYAALLQFRNTNKAFREQANNYKELFFG